MPRTYTSLALADAKQMLSAAEAKAATLGVPYCVAVVDAGGHFNGLPTPGRRADRQC